VFVPGVHMEVIPDDGSKSWRREYERAVQKPSWVMKDN